MLTQCEGAERGRGWDKGRLEAHLSSLIQTQRRGVWKWKLMSLLHSITIAFSSTSPTIVWMFVFPQNLYVELLISKEMGPFGRWWGCEGGPLINEISALQIGSRELVCPFHWWGDSEKAPSLNQEEGSHQILNLPTFWSWTSQLPELWEINSCCL